MSLDVDLINDFGKVVFEYNITHNLGAMASAVGLYGPLWRPEEANPPITHARELIEPIRNGVVRLRSGGKHLFKTFEPDNGWGKWENLVAFAEAYLEACIKFPDARVIVCR